MRSTRDPISRRKLLKAAGAGTAGMLLPVHTSFASPPTANLNDNHPATKPQILAGDPGTRITLTSVTPQMLRITISAVMENIDLYCNNGDLASRTYPPPLHTQRADQTSSPVDIPWGEHTIHIETVPLRVSVRHPKRGIVQELTFHPDQNQVHFQCGAAPVYGLGPGTHPLDRRGTKDLMRNGAGDNLRIFGARNPIPWLWSKGWALYFHLPTGAFDLTGDQGVWHPSDVARSQDIFLIIDDTPDELLRQYAELTGYPHLPALWTFGFQQSHRTLDNREQILSEAQTFRQKKLPCDALIYLGTGFCPSGWNTGHGSFAFNRTVLPDPQQILRDFHDKHFKVVLHVVNPPETLHGSVQDTAPAASVPGDAANYWQQHQPLLDIGVSHSTAPKALAPTTAPSAPN